MLESIINKMGEYVPVYGESYDKILNLFASDVYFEPTTDLELFYIGAYKYSRLDMKEAEEYFLKSAELGNSHAMYNLGFLCEHRKADNINAEEWYFKSAKLGNNKSYDLLRSSLIRRKD